MNTAFFNSSSSTLSDDINDRGFAAAAAAKNEEAEGYTKRIRSLNRKKWIMVAVLCVLDLCLFYQPITAVLYDMSEIENAVLSIACAIGPILTAVWTAGFARRAMFDDGEKSQINVAIAIGLALLTGFLLYQGWQVRSDYWGADGASATALYLNIVAVAFAIAAFTIDFLIERQLWENRFAYDAAIIERDLLSTMDYKSHFAFMKEIDETRRANDDADITRARASVIEAGLDAAGRARKALAKRVAQSAAEFEYIMDTPIKIGTKLIKCDSKPELQEAVARELGVKSAEQAREDWGPGKSRYLGEQQIEDLDAFAARYDVVRAIGAPSTVSAASRSSYGRSDEDDGPIQTQYEVVY